LIHLGLLFIPCVLFRPHFREIQLLSESDYFESHFYQFQITLSINFAKCRSNWVILQASDICGSYVLDTGGAHTQTHKCFRSISPPRPEKTSPFTPKALLNCMSSQHIQLPICWHIKRAYHNKLYFETRS
jgi:hypothetical protein